jgi:hypothetical protein
MPRPGCRGDSQRHGARGEPLIRQGLDDIEQQFRGSDLDAGAGGNLEYELDAVARPSLGQSGMTGADAGKPPGESRLSLTGELRDRPAGTGVVD